MKIAVLLKSGPFSNESSRALRVASDMLSQGHAVNLYLLQDAVHFCQPDIENAASIELNRLVDKKLRVNFLIQDAKLRGIDVKSIKHEISGGNYEELMDLMESSDRVIGLL
jgi:sulfur relay (sulfurtransferase) complex TusBCD TusD component (DsrE family)